MSTCYKYAPYGGGNIDLSYVDGCVYWYTSETIVKCFLGTLGKIFHMDFLVYANWFMLIIHIWITIVEYARTKSNS